MCKIDRHLFLSQAELIQSTHRILYFNIDLNIILATTSRNSKWSLCFRFPHKNSVYIYILPHTFHMPRSSHLFDLSTRVMFVEEHNLHQAIFSTFLLFPPLRPKCLSQQPIIEHCCLCSKWPNFTVIQKRDKIIIPYILILTFLGSWREEKKVCIEL